MRKDVENMTKIQLTLTGAEACAKTTGTLTSGMVGVEVRILCDSAWDGLTKTLVCKSAAGERVVLHVGDTAQVPHEVLCLKEEAPDVLWMGLEGRNADGTVVIPSVWAQAGLILPGVTTEADPSTAADNPAWAELAAEMGDLTALQTRAKADLVSAVNELWEKTPEADNETILETNGVLSVRLASGVTAGDPLPVSSDAVAQLVGDLETLLSAL